MKDVFEQATYDELVDRINKLRPDTQRQWGKMDVAQMMAHCSNALEISVGDNKHKRGLMAKLMGPFVKSIVTSDKPFKHSLPTDKNFLISDSREFDKEKVRLTSLLSRFSKGGPAEAVKNVHPFFGRFTAEEWSRSTYKHLDHHLRQFGA